MSGAWRREPCAAPRGSCSGRPPRGAASLPVPSARVLPGGPPISLHTRAGIGRAATCGSPMSEGILHRPWESWPPTARDRGNGRALLQSVTALFADRRSKPRRLTTRKDWPVPPDTSLQARGSLHPQAVRRAAPEASRGRAAGPVRQAVSPLQCAEPWCIVTRGRSTRGPTDPRLPRKAQGTRGSGAGCPGPDPRSTQR